MALTDMKWYIVCPTDTRVNYITNPSFEVNTTGWAAYNGTISQSITQQAYGCYSCKVEPDTGTVAGAKYPVALLSGSTYVFSVDVYGVNGQSMSVWFADSGTVLAGTEHSWVANGHWQRRSVTFAATATATFNLMVTRGSVASLGAWYFDAAQLEYSNESTYIDGDQPGLVMDETAYYWNGTRHASTSTRSAYTRAGGTLLCLNDYMQIKNVQGLGMAPVTNSAIDSSLGGAYFQNTTAGSRPLVISGAVTGDNASTPEGNKQTKLDLIADAIAFDRVATTQEMVIEYQGVDASGEECSERLRLNCVYNGGFERSWDTNVAEDITLQFVAYQPWFVDVRERAINCGYQYEITDFGHLLKRDGVTGQWGKLGTGIDASPDVIIYDSVGNLYAGGNFGTAGSVVCNNIAKWDGVDWGSLGNGLNDAVRDIVIDPAGNLYALGDFGTAGTVASRCIAKWNGSDWGSVGAGLTGGGGPFGYGLAIDGKGRIYASGIFGTAGTVVCKNVAVLTDGTTWGSLGAGVNSTHITYVEVDNNDNVYVGGDFGTAGTIACSNIAKWNQTTSTWGSLGSGLDNDLYTMYVNKRGDLYCGGIFHVAGGGTVNHLARWNGNNWDGVGSGANDYVRWIMDYDGAILIGGVFTSINGDTNLQKAAVYSNNTFKPLTVRAPSGYVIAAAINKNTKDMVISGLGVGTAYSCIDSVPNCGGAVAYPFYEVTGPGTLVSIENYTTKSAILFDNFFVNSGEMIRIDADPSRPSIYSDSRANLMRYLLPGSSMDLKLISGTNHMNVFMYGGTDANSKALMRWRNRYWTVDQAKYA